MPQPNILLCTVGTSLFFPNLEALKAKLNAGTIELDLKGLAESYQSENWKAVAGGLGERDPSERLCGAEINSIASMISREYVPADVGVYFFHSATPHGRSIAAVLQHYYRQRGHAPVEIVEVADLQDQNTRRFKTYGLRNLARELCKAIRNHSASACAINATGGYKAQIAIAVLLGQALGAPVYYKHERFDEIIGFPPMPVALDFEVWMKASGILGDLNRDAAPFSHYADEWDPKYDALVERVRIDDQEFVELSSTGQIFHETFQDRFRSLRDDVLPPPVPADKKRTPRLEKSGWPGEHPEIRRFMQRATDQVPSVVRCSSTYFNPDCPQRTRFRLGASGIEGVLSDGTYCVKFAVESSAQTDGQRLAVVAALNDWLNQGGHD